MPIQVLSFADVVDPGVYSIDEAEKLALLLMAEGQRILELQGEPPPDNGRAERIGLRDAIVEFEDPFKGLKVVRGGERGFGMGSETSGRQRCASRCERAGGIVAGPANRTTP